MEKSVISTLFKPNLNVVKNFSKNPKYKTSQSSVQRKPYISMWMDVLRQNNRLPDRHNDAE